MVNGQAKGKRAELRVAQALTRSGLPSRRHVRTGTQFEHDEGDLRLTVAPVTIEVKDWAKGYSRNQIAELLEKLGRQKRPGDLGLLVCKPSTVADPYGWDCWVTVEDAVRVLDGRQQPGYRWPAPGGFEHPVKFVFGDVIRALVSGGWVTELTNPFQNKETS